MNKIDLGYKTIGEVARRWCGKEDKEGQWSRKDCLEVKPKTKEILEYGACGQLEIWRAKSYRGNDNISPFMPRQARIPGPLPRQAIEDCLNNWSIEDYDKNIITNKELYRFETKYGIQIAAKAKNDYPPELKITVEVWDKVFAHGLKPQDPPKSQHDMVRDALKPYKIEGSEIDRICYVVIEKKTGSRSKVTEPTTTEHTRNEPGHPHHAPLLKTAVEVWKACKDLEPYKEKAGKWLKRLHDGLGTNECKKILTLTNPKPHPGRPKKG